MFTRDIQIDGRIFIDGQGSGTSGYILTSAGAGLPIYWSPLNTQPGSTQWGGNSGDPIFYVQHVLIGSASVNSYNYNLAVVGNAFVSSDITSANIIPSVDNFYTLGTPAKRWKNIQVGPGTIFIQDQQAPFTQIGLSVSGGFLLLDNAQGLRTGNVYFMDGTIQQTAYNPTANISTYNGFFSNALFTGNLFTYNATASNALFAYNATASNALFTGNLFAYNATASNALFTYNATASNALFTGNLFAYNATASNALFAYDATASNAMFAPDFYGNVHANSIVFSDSTIQKTAYVAPTANIIPTASATVYVDLSSSNSYIVCNLNSGGLNIYPVNPTPGRCVEVFATWNATTSGATVTIQNLAGKNVHAYGVNGSNAGIPITKTMNSIRIISADKTFANTFAIVSNY